MNGLNAQQSRQLVQTKIAGVPSGIYREAIMSSGENQNEEAFN